jgi:hypothetical protein
MLKVDALEFFRLGERSGATASDVFYTPTRTLHDSDKERVKNDIVALSDLWNRIGLTTSLSLLKDRENDIPQPKREWEILVAAVRAELKTNLFLFVPSHRAKYYEMTLLSTVTGGFPTASKEWWRRATA